MMLHNQYLAASPFLGLTSGLSAHNFPLGGLAALTSHGASPPGVDKVRVLFVKELKYSNVIFQELQKYLYRRFTQLNNQ